MLNKKPQSVIKVLRKKEILKSYKAVKKLSAGKIKSHFTAVFDGKECIPKQKGRVIIASMSQDSLLKDYIVLNLSPESAKELRDELNRVLD